MADCGPVAASPLSDCQRATAAIDAQPPRTAATAPVADVRSNRHDLEMPVIYPFSPKSNAQLSEGDFWAIPLVDGSYACGRVMQLPPKGFPGPGSRVQFLGSLMDWHGPHMPESTDLSGVGSTVQAVMHVLSITRTGGHVIGNRKLSLDKLEPSLFINGSEVQRGYDYVREFKRGEVLPEWSHWGWNVIWLLANRHFLRLNLPDDDEPARHDHTGSD